MPKSKKTWKKSGYGKSVNKSLYIEERVLKKTQRAADAAGRTFSNFVENHLDKAIPEGRKNG